MDSTPRGESAPNATTLSYELRAAAAWLALALPKLEERSPKTAKRWQRLPGRLQALADRVEGR